MGRDGVGIGRRTKMVGKKAIRNKQVGRRI